LRSSSFTKFPYFPFTQEQKHPQSPNNGKLKGMEYIFGGNMGKNIAKRGKGKINMYEWSKSMGENELKQ